MLSIEQSADYSTLSEVTLVETWMSWEAWSLVTLEKDCEVTILDGNEWSVFCVIERKTVLARKAKPAVVRPGYVYALGIAAAIPCGFMPVVGMALYGGLVLGMYSQSQPEVDEEHYNYLLDQA